MYSYRAFLSIVVEIVNVLCHAEICDCVATARAETVT